MQKFLNDNGLPYELVWDLAVLGCKTKRVSKLFNKQQQELAIKTGKKPRNRFGRPGEYEYDCTFCHDIQGPPGELR